MRRFFLSVCFCGLFYLPLQAQTSTQDSIYRVAIQLFDAMRNADSVKLMSCFTPEARLQIIDGDLGAAKINTELVTDFAAAVAHSRPSIWDERPWSYEIKLDGPLAHLWMEYGFYLNDTLLHCGIDAMQLVRTTLGWKILQLADTRHPAEDCGRFAGGQIHLLLDNWHLAAATGNEDLFFGSMTADAIYIGTDISERWRRDEMRLWAQPFFDRPVAWDFIANNRQIYVVPNAQTAWFEEELETWMGPCRGSGALQKTAAGWKIVHYVLSAAVPNDAMNSYLEVLKKMPAPPKIRDRG